MRSFLRIPLIFFVVFVTSSSTLLAASNIFTPEHMSLITFIGSIGGGFFLALGFVKKYAIQPAIDAHSVNPDAHTIISLTTTEEIAQLDKKLHDVLYAISTNLAVMVEHQKNADEKLAALFCTRNPDIPCPTEIKMRSNDPPGFNPAVLRENKGMRFNDRATDNVR